jgi:hypothetical protein
MLGGRVVGGAPSSRALLSLWRSKIGQIYNKTVPVLAPNVLQDYPDLDKRRKGGMSRVEFRQWKLVNVTLVGEQDWTIVSSASWTSFLMNALVSIIFERSPSASPLSRKTSIPGPRATNISLKVDVACRLSAVRMFRRQPFVANWTTFERAEKTAGSDRESEEDKGRFMLYFYLTIYL